MTRRTDEHDPGGSKPSKVSRRAAVAGGISILGAAAAVRAALGVADSHNDDGPRLPTEYGPPNTKTKATPPAGHARDDLLASGIPEWKSGVKYSVWVPSSLVEKAAVLFVDVFSVTSAHSLRGYSTTAPEDGQLVFTVFDPSVVEARALESLRRRVHTMLRQHGQTQIWDYLEQVNLLPPISA